MLKYNFFGKALAAVGGAVLGLSAAAAPAGATEQGIKVNFQVYIGGFQVAKSDLDLGLRNDCFDLRLAIEPHGLIGYFSPFKLVSATDGCNKGAEVVPTRYSVDYYKDGRKKRFVRVDFNGGKDLLVQAEPLPEDDNRKVVPGDLRDGSLDPLSGVFAIAGAVAREGRCDGEQMVYDGRRLFRLNLSHVGTTEMSPSSYAAYAGPAIECDIKVETVAGFKKSEIRKKHFPEKVKVFLAEAVAGAPLLPVRMEADYRFGRIRVHAATITPAERQTEETQIR